MPTQNLPVHLTTDELLTRAEGLAKAITERDVHVAAAKAAASSAKAKTDLLEKEVSRLATIVKERREDRPVDVTDIRNWERRTIDTIRLDTGEVVGYRSMTAAEKNGDLFEEEREAARRRSIAAERAEDEKRRVVQEELAREAAEPAQAEPGAAQAEGPAQAVAAAEEPSPAAEEPSGEAPAEGPAN